VTRVPGASIPSRLLIFDVALAPAARLIPNSATRARTRPQKSVLDHRVAVRVT